MHPRCSLNTKYNQLNSALADSNYNVMKVHDLTITGTSTLDPEDSKSYTGTIDRASSSSSIFYSSVVTGWCNINGISISGNTVTVNFVNPGNYAHTPSCRLNILELAAK